MNTNRFKTNIINVNSLSEGSPYLDDLAGEDNWAVDLQNPQKNLVVLGDFSGVEVIDVVGSAGFEADSIVSEKQLQF